MKTLFAAILVVVLAAVGYFLYMQSAPGVETDTTPDTDINIIPQQQPTTPTMQTSTSTATTSESGDVREITVTSTGMAFNQKTLTVQKGERVRITYQNGGGTHDLRIDGYDVGTEVISGGESETFEFIADEAGDFQFYCSVGNHRAMGMWGTLTVEE